MTESRDPRRDLPSIDRLLAHPRAATLIARFNREYVTRSCREILSDVRGEIEQGRTLPADGLREDAILTRLEQKLEMARDTGLRQVVNATGTVLHTNLGRAPLAHAAIEALQRVAARPVNLEYDLDRGARGKREDAIEKLLVDLTGAEAATVVNNNAAAVLLALNSLAMGREVIVSRGELIEIGGAFRIPEIMSKSGAMLVEVGTTNRTHPQDYERAINPNTALLLKVHTSNYRIVGFSAEVGLVELVALGKKHNLPVMEDLGSGALVDLSRYGLPREPVVSERVAAGADVVTFSGDKVLGGPQAGLIVGKRRWLTAIASNPLHRAVRCGKLTIAALEATLTLYQRSPEIADDIPTLKAFTRPVEELQRLGEQLLPRLQHALGSGFRLSLEQGGSQVGSGALPTEEIPTRVIAIQHDVIGAERIAARFRRASPPIIGRIKDDRFLLDLRTIFEPEDLIPKWRHDPNAEAAWVAEVAEKQKNKM